MPATGAIDLSSASPALMPLDPKTEHESATAELPPDIAEQLSRPLPKEAVSRHPDKPGLSAVKAIYVVERLNEVFGLNGWQDDYEVVETGRMIVVRGRLRIPRYGIVRQQYGGNSNPDRGDAYKGACTDALSKCASQVGIAIDVYKGLHTLQDPETIDLRPDSADSRAGRFREMERILGPKAYLSVFLRNGFPEEPATISVEAARAIYTGLLRLLRGRFEILRQLVDTPTYRRVLCSLRLNASVKLNAEQLIDVFEALWEMIDVRPR